MPLPMVLATAVPMTKAATKLKNAAQTTATRGESTRVETTVAMLLAASWKPLMKSKLSATATVRTSSHCSGVTGAGSSQARLAWKSGALQDDALQHVGHVFAVVAGGFQDLVELLEFDESDGVLLALEQGGDGFARHPVSLVLQAFDLYAIVEDVVVLLQQRDRAAD